MRVLIDTNILISSALSNKGTPYRAFIKAVSYPNHGLICEQNIDEMRRIFNRKFPQKISALESSLDNRQKPDTISLNQRSCPAFIYLQFMHLYYLLMLL